jgi:hypothetical protein
MRAVMENYNVLFNNEGGATTKQYLVAGVLVEAIRSAGGRFYELTVIATGQKQRYLSDVFESIAKPVYSKTEINS